MGSYSRSKQNHSFNFLETLEIRNCDSLCVLSLDLFPKLVRLELEDCRNFESLSVSSEPYSERQQYLITSLIKLQVWECLKFESFSLLVEGGSSLNLNAPNLKDLGFYHLENLKSLPEDMHILLPSLRHLWLYDCPQLESFPIGGLPSNLVHLSIEMCPKLVGESFLEERLLPTNLECLYLHGYQNLKTINYKGLLHLQSLRRVTIDNCLSFSFKCLPEESLPRSISELQIGTTVQCFCSVARGK
ncbi:Disease resistance protein [Quillaja saponaria]|uniref:Disease resistance protein n=1 Tax=Quillaja saponaria TaxID=32244 RepID=A0AAD7PLI6_QUISA|nr:Disease resistance protein [Quillaja saponaria]